MQKNANEINRFEENQAEINAKLEAKNPNNILSDQKILAKRLSICFMLDVSPQTLWRYTSNPDYAHLNFPQPKYIGKTPYWLVHEVMEWTESLAANPK